MYLFYYFRSMPASVISLYKKAYSGLSQKTWYLSLVMLVNRSGTMVVPFLTMYCTQKLGLTITQAGNVLACYGMGAITGGLIGGKITDVFGFYKMQVFALLLGGCMFIILGYVHSYEWLCFTTFILSTCNDSFRPANAAAIAHYSEPENRTRSYSLNRLAINLGWAVGGTLGGFIAAQNYQWLFWVDGCTNILAAFLLLWLLPYVKTGSRQSSAIKKEKAASAYRDKTYIFFLLATILFASCFFLGFTMQPPFFKQEWHFGEEFIGVLLALNGVIIVIIEMVLIYKIENAKSPANIIAIGVITVGIGFALVNVLPQAAWVALLSIIFFTVGEMFSMPLMNTFWVSRSNENNRGQYASLYTVAWSIAQIAAPALGGRMVQQYGFATLWYSALAVCAVSAVCFSVLKKK